MSPDSSVKTSIGEVQRIPRWVPHRRSLNRQGFTLVELLVVIAMIGILIGLLLPAIQAAREAARRMTCGSNIMQLGVAISNYEMAHQVLPPGTVDAKGPIVHLPIGYHHNWIVQILPMMDERVAYNKLDHRQSVYAKVNFPVRAYGLSLLSCPSTWGSGTYLQSSYAGVHDSREVPIDVDNNGVFFLNSSIAYEEIIDGTSHTAFLGEKLTDPTELGWVSGTRATLRNMGAPFNYAPLAGAGANNTNLGESIPPGFVGGFESPTIESGAYELVETDTEGLVVSVADGEGPVRTKENLKAADLPTQKMVNAPPANWMTIGDLPVFIGNRKNNGTDVGGFGSNHTGGVNMLLGDGSVQFISQNIDSTVQQQLGNRADQTLTPAIN